MEIYRRASERLKDEDIYHVWISSAMRIYGVSKCREVYDYILNHTENETTADWCLRYADFEVKITEYQRARDILLYGAQFADPSKMEYFWNHFDEFEHSHGTKETFAEMLSQKNIAAQRFNTTVNVGMAGEIVGSEDDDLLLEEIENHRLLSVQEQLIPKTVYDSGINATSQFNPKKRVRKDLN